MLMSSWSKWDTSASSIDDESRKIPVVCWDSGRQTYIIAMDDTLARDNGGMLDPVSSKARASYICTKLGKELWDAGMSKGQSFLSWSPFIRFPNIHICATLYLEYYDKEIPSDRCEMQRGALDLRWTLVFTFTSAP